MTPASHDLDGERDALALIRVALDGDREARDVIFEHADLWAVLGQLAEITAGILIAYEGDETRAAEFVAAWQRNLTEAERHRTTP